MTRTLTSAIAATAMAIGCGLATAHAATLPHGVFALGSLDTDMPADVYADGSVAGATFTSRWSTLEPTQGQFDWTALDARVAVAAAAGRQVALSVTPGVFSPAWLYSLGAAKISFKWTLPWGFTPCSTVNFPLPWDPVYSAAWQGFVSAFGQHYAHNPAVTMVKVTGINSATAELMLPYSVVGQPVSQAAVTCGNTPIAPLSAWKAAGYRPGKVATAWAGFASAFVHAFPAQQLVVQTGGWGFPPIDDFGNVIANSTGDATLARTLLTSGLQAVGSHFALENDGLQDGWHWPRPSFMPASVPIAYQAAAAITGDTTCRMNNFQSPCDPLTVTLGTIAQANALPAEFLELYRPDLQNPVLAAAIAGFGP